jgi:hypothetical protein
MIVSGSALQAKKILYGRSKTGQCIDGWKDSQNCSATHLELAELSGVLVRFDHIASFVVNANHSIIRLRNFA